MKPDYIGKLLGSTALLIIGFAAGTQHRDSPIKEPVKLRPTEQIIDVPKGYAVLIFKEGDPDYPPRPIDPPWIKKESK